MLQKRYCTYNDHTEQATNAQRHAEDRPLPPPTPSHTHTSKQTRARNHTQSHTHALSHARAHSCIYARSTHIHTDTRLQTRPFITIMATIRPFLCVKTKVLELLLRRGGGGGEGGGGRGSKGLYRTVERERSCS